MGAWWDEEKILWLVTPEEFALLPDGFVLHAIDGEQAVKGRDWIDMDTRFGHLAYGASRELVNAALAKVETPTASAAENSDE